VPPLLFPLLRCDGKEEMKDGKDLRPARGETGRDRYDPLSQALHWATAVLVLASFALALWPELVKGSAALHKSLGLALLFVVPLRLGWRLTAGWGGARPGSKGAGTLRRRPRTACSTPCCWRCPCWAGST
jgi:hypothetical protein